MFTLRIFAMEDVGLVEAHVISLNIKSKKTNPCFYTWSLLALIVSLLG